MRRFTLTILMALLVLVNYAQEVTDAEISAIRAAYSTAKEQVELNSHAQEQNVPRSDMEVVSHYVIPGCGPTEEIIHYYFTLDEDPEQGTCVYKPYLITRSYNVAARKFYQEFLFDQQEASLLFFFQSNDAMDGSTDETRYYYGKQGVHQSIKGAAQMDEVFAARLADDLKAALNHLMNRDY
ncbi:MAG: hypothetical protein IKX56_03255 [Muribaculaceae bacterium]|nr:hypothetical protein [Muribaculaceae bacterium]